MRILVVSDSHGNYRALENAIKSQYSAEMILHLGDGDEEIQQIKTAYPEKNIIAVRGNCDYCSTLPSSEEFVVSGKKIFITHGNLYNVKLGYGTIFSKAISDNVDILLFGHTHHSFCEYYEGVYIMNPGSLGFDYTYGTLDIEENGVVTNIVHMKRW